MSEQPLATAFDNVPLAKKDDQLFDAVVSATQYLPRLQLMIANSDPCKQGEFPVNHYALVKDQTVTDLGESVDILLIDFRPKALELGEQVISIFDPKLDENNKPTGEFARIANKSFETDSGCMFGPEFLVWIPQVKQFATFFMGSKSSRREAPNLKARLQKAATLKSKKIETQRYSWFAPVCFDCSTPFAAPSTEELTNVLHKFNNPPERVIESVEDEGDDRAR